ncbi:two-component system histidine kinase PnpS [Alkaliphilus transvaalensis]|uniref:two-component system histidine kinase PnpS n=1 Tax=Alkaliphilus transvaalensis TaxID=114628 RepID=UPI00047D46D4|nr:ATP-binding protein [Alkaliphilus transvaalensis]
MQKRIFSAFIVILLLGVLLTGFLNLSLIRTNYLNELENKLVSNGFLIEEFLKENLQQLTESDLKRITEDYGRRIDARITFIDNHGEVLADTMANEQTIENHRNRKEVIEALNGRVGTDLRRSTTLDEEMFYVAIPVDLNINNLRVIRLAVNLQEITRINQTQYFYIIISILIGLLPSLMLAYRFVDKIMEPIKAITEVTKKIAAGGFDRRVEVITDDEIGELANNFNNMAERLKETISKLSENNTKFKALLTSMKNPIIAVDNKHRLILLNPAAEELFQMKMEDALGKHILEVIRNNVLDEQLKDILQNNVENQIEVTTEEPSEKILKIYSNPIKLEEDPSRIIGIVALIEDVTEIRRLEKMRSDFVANVSHELKTPLTSISGFVETLKSGGIDDEDTKLRFLDIIDIETERLTRLINDILTLSEIENTQLKAMNQEILTSEALLEVEEIMRPIANGKDIELVTGIEYHLPILQGNPDWFKQMLINLLDNAIKYTPNEGKVYLHAFEKYNNIIITVKDTGIGIPKKDLPRLFERFYRVDKARSRKVGGTGLGLAIVKHIVLSLKGKIKVNSELDKGTEFTVIIPID